MSLSDPLGPVELVACNAMYVDPALDLEDPAIDEGVPEEARPLPVAAMLAKYRETLDPRVLRFKPGATPHRFVVKPLPVTYAAHILATYGDVLRFSGAFMAACHQIKLADGGELRPAKLKPVHSVSLPADEAAWLTEVLRRFGLATVHQIGQAAYDRATRPLPEHAAGPFVSRPG